MSRHTSIPGSLGKNCFGNSPVYACPVRHWRSHPRTSRWFARSGKCLVCFNDGWNRSAMGNLPLIWAFFNPSCLHARSIDTFARRNAFARVVPTFGAPHGFSVPLWRAHLLGCSLLSGSVMGTTRPLVVGIQLPWLWFVVEDG
jgi:hypothetical protein